MLECIQLLYYCTPIAVLLWLAGRVRPRASDKKEAYKYMMYSLAIYISKLCVKKEGFVLDRRCGDATLTRVVVHTLTPPSSSLSLGC